MLILETILSPLFLEKVFDFVLHLILLSHCLFLALNGLKSYLSTTVTFKTCDCYSFAVTCICLGKEGTMSLCSMIHMWVEPTVHEIHSCWIPQILHATLSCWCPVEGPGNDLLRRAQMIQSTELQFKPPISLAPRPLSVCHHSIARTGSDFHFSDMRKPAQRGRLWKRKTFRRERWCSSTDWELFG